MIVEGIKERCQSLQPPHNKGHVQQKGQRVPLADRHQILQRLRLKEFRQLEKLVHHHPQPLLEERHGRAEVQTLTVKQKTTSTEKLTQKRGETLTAFISRTTIFGWQNNASKQHGPCKFGWVKLLHSCARALSANLSRKARLSRVHLEEVELAKGVRGD